jgi:hypothetical protein
MVLILIFWAQWGWSYTVSGTTYTTNGSQSDVQAACNAAPDNGTVTVVIPNGTYQWSGNLAINHAVTVAGASANGVIIDNDFATGDMIDATSSANGHVNIYWLNIVQIANNGAVSRFALSCNRTEPSSYTVLVHDCTFKCGSIYNYMVQCQANGIIFWNDTFIGDGPNDPNAIGGISFVCGKYGATSSWNTPSTYGTQDVSGLANTYIENCTFYDGAGGNVDDNSRVVARDSTFQGTSLWSHGQETSIYGARQFEIYNNTFKYPTSGTGPSGNTYPMNTQCFWGGRGGAGKNEISLTVYSINRADSIPCQVAYPAARQTGQGWSASSTATFGNPAVSYDGIGAVTEGVYIWGNTGTGPSDPHFVGLDQYAPDDCGHGLLVTQFLQQGRDYFVGTAKPNYNPYQYPHPLHTAFAVTGASRTPTPTPTATPARPAAPQNLRVGS